MLETKHDRKKKQNASFVFLINKDEIKFLSQTNNMFMLIFTACPLYAYFDGSWYIFNCGGFNWYEAKKKKHILL